MTLAAGAGSPLSGSAVRLVSFANRHISPEYLSWLNDRQLMRFSRQRLQVHTPDSAREYLHGFAGSPHQFWAVERLADGRLVGTMTAYQDVHHQTADLGILIDPGTAGLGFGREAWGLALYHCFDVVGVRKVTAGTAAANLAMVRVTEYWRMTLEGRLRDQELLDNGPTDVLAFGLLRSEWLANPERVRQS